MLFEDLDRTNVIAEEADVPFVAAKIIERDPGVVLHNQPAVIENKIANRAEAAFEQEIGRRFEQARADAKMLTEFQETGVRMDAAVGNIGGEIIQGL